jgi:hypothetical protein
MTAAKAPRADVAASELPQEIWVHVARSLTPRAIARLCTANKLLWGAQDACLEQSCYHQYPQHAGVARRLTRLSMRARWTMVEAHEQELSFCAMACHAAAPKQPVILPKHRAILVEWLAEVSAAPADGAKPGRAAQGA